MERFYSVDDKLQFYYYGLHLRCCRSRHKMSRLRSQFGLRLNNRREEGHTSYAGISTCFYGNIFVQKWAGPFRTWCTPIVAHTGGADVLYGWLEGRFVARPHLCARYPSIFSRSTVDTTPSMQIISPIKASFVYSM